MKAIDEKGRLFGLVNVVDLFILLIHIFTVVFGVRRYLLKPDESKMMTQATLVFEIQNVRQITLDTLKEGHTLYYADGSKKIGTITKVENVPYEEPLEIDGEWVNKPVPGKYSLLVTVDGTVKDDGTSLWIHDIQTRVGISYLLKTKYINVEGVLVGIDVEE